MVNLLPSTVIKDQENANLILQFPQYEEHLKFKQISSASIIQSTCALKLLQYLMSLRRTRTSPVRLSIDGNILVISKLTNKSCSPTPDLLIHVSSICDVLRMGHGIDSTARLQCFSTNNDKFSMGVPHPDVMTRAELSILCL